MISHEGSGQDPSMSVYEWEQLAAEPIPLSLPYKDGWKDIPITPSFETNVPLGMDSSYSDIYTDAIYAGEHSSSPYPEGLDGALKTIFVRTSVAEGLAAVERKLPTGLHVVVFDGYRPTEVQQALFDRYYQSLAATRPDMDPVQLLAETEKYVALPSIDPNQPAPHSTGGAVDVAFYHLPPPVEGRIRRINDKLFSAEGQERFQLKIEKFNLITQYGKMLNFGTPLYHAGPESVLNYFEEQAEMRQLSTEEIEAQRNRRALYYLMLDVAKLQPYDEEWWHYNSPNTQMGAKTAGLTTATLGAAALMDANVQMLEILRDSAEGDLRKTTSMAKAAIIAAAQS